MIERNGLTDLVKVKVRELRAQRIEDRRRRLNHLRAWGRHDEIAAEEALDKMAKLAPKGSRHSQWQSKFSRAVVEEAVDPAAVLSQIALSMAREIEGAWQDVRVEIIVAGLRCDVDLGQNDKVYTLWARLIPVKVPVARRDRDLGEWWSDAGKALLPNFIFEEKMYFWD